MDIIETMRMRKLNPDLYPLKQILADVPTLDYENPMLYALYLHHNKAKLTKDEIATVCETIDTLKHNRDVTDKINMAYMTRHERVQST